MYKIKCDATTGVIYAGTLSKDKKKIQRAQPVTREVLEAARDHLLVMGDKNKEDTAYCWPLDNGGAIILETRIVDPDQVQEGDENTEAPAGEKAAEEPKPAPVKEIKKARKSAKNNGTEE